VERSVETFAVIHFVIVGLSHLLRPRAWVAFFQYLHSLGHPGVFVHGLLSLGFGSVVVAFHNVWTGLPAVLTVVGYIYLFKASLCFLIPETQMKTLGRVAPERAYEMRVPGVVYLVLAMILSFSLLR
jgi:uncharacterized protein YjeT (DUF2065 family)